MSDDDGKKDNDYSFAQKKTLNKFKILYKKEEEIDEILNYERKLGKKTTVKLHNLNNILDFSEINYPLPELKGFPIINSGTNELIYIYFPNEYFEHLKILILKENQYSFAKSKNILNIINPFIFFFHMQFFNQVKLEERIEKSYKEPLVKQKTVFSVALEMTEKFKNKPKIYEKLKNFRNFGKDIKQFSNVIKKEYNIFENLNNKKQIKKGQKLIEKIGFSFLEKGKNEKEENDYSEEEEEIFYEKINDNKNIINNNTQEENFDYKNLLYSLFCERINDFRREIIYYCLNEDNNLSFESFICYIEFFICLFSGIRVKYYIDELSYLNLDFYADEKILMNLAETYHYQVQFKIFDLAIQRRKNGKFYNRENKELNIFQLNISKNKKLNIINSELYENLIENFVEYYPPYNDFIKALSHKYRRYDSKDNYHICKDCSDIKTFREVYNLNCSSCFRVIDKLRLISISLSSIINLDNIDNNHIFKYCILMPNYKVINYLITFKLILFSSLNPFNIKENKLINKIFRNTYGEYIGFYFSWIFCYTKWLFIPSILGLIIHFLRIFSFSTSLSLFFELFFCGFIILWGNYFVQFWKSREKFLCYIWGMKNFKIERRSDILKQNSGDIEFFMGVKIPVYYHLDNCIKKFIIICIIIISQIIQISLNLLIFMLQSKRIFLKEKDNKFIKYDFWAYLCPIICFIIREISSFFFSKVNKFLNSLESYFTKEEYKRTYLNKQILFEFFNYYFNLYYIAFFKRYFETCYLNDCYQELGNQLTMILISDLIFTLIKLIYNYIYLSRKISKFEGRILDKYMNIRNPSKKYIFYTRMHYGHDDIIKLFLPIILNFGYIVQFGSASPISLIFTLFLTIFFKITDVVSFKFLKYIRTYKDSKGLDFFNDIMKISSFFGLISNLSILFYTNKNFIFVNGKIKLIIFIIVQNFLFMCIKLIPFKYFPYWFPFRTRVEIKYLKKHGIRQKNLFQKKNN